MDYDPAHAMSRGGSMRRSISRSVSRASRNLEDIFSPSSRRTKSVNEDEEALKWAAIEKLPTYSRLRTSLMPALGEDDIYGNQILNKEVDVTKLDGEERAKFIDMVFKVAEQDNERILTKLRNRIDRVGITLPTVEVRYDHLTVKADCYTGDRSLPSLTNTVRNMGESLLGLVGIHLAKKAQLTILKDVSGIVKPSRMTLLLGPPSSGKTTLLLALAGKLDKSLDISGEVTYNGYRLNEFVPIKTSAYISQNDLHVGIMTVKETLDFSARCQGVGTRYDLLNELARREKDAGIFPEADVDLFMKASAAQGVKSSLITDYTLKILGLDICKDTIVGDDMMRGISGGQKKRVTTGEMIVGPTKTLFMDEISTGLDSSTTFQIVKCLQQIVHLTEATVVISLLQPAPETFDLFDDIILLSEGQTVYQGPRDHIVEFFESFGFKCPERKGTADFLQEVTSKKDQEQYWVDQTKPYRYITVPEFARKFKTFHVGNKLSNELSVPFDKSKGHKAALVFDKYSVKKSELLKTCWDKEWMLMKRNSFFYVFKTVSIIIIAAILSSVFLRTEMNTRNEADANMYMGALLFGLIMNMFNGLAEMAMTIQRLPVFYKQRDLLFHPPWAYTLPTFLLGIPISIFETTAWMVVTYYSIGLAPEAERFFKQFLIIFLVQQMAAGIFRFIASICRTMTIANTGGMLALLVVFLTGGFLLPRREIPVWWRWAFWASPLSYGFNAISVNELFAPRWMNKMSSDNTTRLGTAMLNMWGVFDDKNWYWIGIGGLFGFAVLFNGLFTLALSYLDPLGKPQAILPKEEDESKNEIPMENVSTKKGMVLPFTPLALSFDDVKYFVDMPAEMRDQGVQETRLQLLKGVTSTFRPGVLTALMGVSGAGKTTLMDVLAGRKTGGYIEGDIRVSGFPKKQETFARISGYCEQTDIHSPQITVRESLIFSAFLRLAKEVSKEEKMMFVDQVMELVELVDLRDAIVGIPGVTGLSTEQRKRLTIAVELVANPSIIFMDEPTSGLDARAAAIVMRAVRNTVDTGRTVVCTIHQPSIDIFEAFDELLLMKRGGQVIYSGPLGRNSHKIVEYFEAIPGVPKIPEKYNPATWMLEASSLAAELKLGVDFAELYKSSSLCQRNKQLVQELSVPPQGASDLYFATQFSQNTWGQYKSCLWKQWWTYWRSPDYNVVRFIFTLATALMIGSVFWQIGGKRSNVQDLTMVLGAIYSAVIFIGVNNCSTVQPLVAVERTVFYREKAAGIPKIPKWWIWYYWICPVAWTIYGLITSQYGDVETPIAFPGGPPNLTVKQYLKDQYGFESDFMGPVAAVLVIFPVFFAFVFAFCIKTLNFQTR
ncbi:hypothetical protein IGI04_022257 [Brassica rapa subsp. trilocularis]|uniref:ABC transporter domain-containing protein n=1 Tax=Brassica rapa subsp. trilocularis TaxID=1813537 RepID=A0ABQ7M3X5_BRACM|nr:hypothetical protein IGI04_022257 [Brassica rapa subsp. trilocularis]